MRIRTRLFAVAFASSLLGTAPALALSDSDKEAIRVLSNQAAADFDQGRYEAARDKFERAYALASVPKLAVWLARSQEKLGRWVEAYELYRQAVSLQPNELWKGTVQQNAQSDARAAIDALYARIPRLTLSVEGAPLAEVKVTIDGAEVPSGLLSVERLLNPGEHDVVARFGEQSLNEHVSLSERDVKALALRFTSTQPTPAAAAPIAATAVSSSPLPAPPAIVPPQTQTQTQTPAPGALAGSAARRPGAGQRTVGWVSVGLGAAGIGLGAVTGVLLAGKYSDLTSKCELRVCPAERKSDVESYDRLRTLSSVGFIAGGALTALGVTLLLTAPKSGGTTGIELVVSARDATLLGVF
ncbi:MAG TPA: tetratricopeptide repeat protein [Polyangiaceae bacterium]|nr:tetratricopeptide repeat protein [Polyangiaceae bacterium]